MRVSKTVLFGALLASAAFSHSALAQSAQGYPVRPLRFVVGLAPGGATDIVARLIAQKLTEELGQTVIVDNRAGAAGSIAGALVAKATPDGYTAHVVSSSYAINPSLHDLPFDSLKDLTPVTLIAQAPFLLVTTPALKIKSVKDLIARAKAKPGTMHFSSGGYGGSGHLAGELFKKMADIKIDHVAFRGGSPSVQAVIAGEVHFTFSAIVAGLQHWKAGRLDALGVTSAKRSKAAPELPTIAEAGVPGYQVLTWYGVLVPAGTPAPIVTKLSSTIAKIVNSPEIEKKFLTGGAEPVGSTPKEFREHLEDEIARIAKLANEIGLKAGKKK